MNNRSLRCQEHSFTRGTILRGHGATVAAMKANPSASMLALQRNMKIVLKARNWDLKDWAKKAEISYRVLNYYENLERAPALNTLDALAAAAGLTTTELIASELTVEMVKSRELANVMHDYVHASEKARAYVA